MIRDVRNLHKNHSATFAITITREVKAEVPTENAHENLND